MVITDNEISDDQKEISAPKSLWNRPGVDGKCVDVHLMVTSSFSSYPTIMFRNLSL